MLLHKRKTNVEQTHVSIVAAHIDINGHEFELTYTLAAQENFVCFVKGGDRFTV